MAAQEGVVATISPLNETVLLFEDTINRGILAIGPYSLSLLTSLLIIEVVVLALLWAADGGPQLGKAIQRIFVVTILSGLLLNGGQNYKDAVDVVRRSAEAVGGKTGAGSRVGGVPGQAEVEPLSVRQPDSIIERGFLLVGKQVAESSSGVFGILAGGFTLLLAFMTLMAFAVLALVCAVTYIELQLLMVCGMILLPFGVFRPTAFLAEKVFGMIVSFAVRILVLSVMIGIANDRLTTVGPADISNWPHMVNLAVLALLLSVLGWHAPSMAASLLTGTPSLNPGAAMATGAAMVGSSAMRVVGSAASAPYAAGAGAVAGALAGGASALGGFMRGGGSGSSPTPPTLPSLGGDGGVPKPNSSAMPKGGDSSSFPGGSGANGPLSTASAASQRSFVGAALKGGLATGAGAVLGAVGGTGSAAIAQLAGGKNRAVGGAFSPAAYFNSVIKHAGAGALDVGKNVGQKMANPNESKK